MTSSAPNNEQRHITLRQMLDELRNEGDEKDRELLGELWTERQEHDSDISLGPPLEPPYFWNREDAGKLIISPRNDNFFIFFNVFLMAMNEREAHLAHWGRTSQGDESQVTFLLRRICEKGRTLGIDVPIWLGEFHLYNMVRAVLSNALTEQTCYKRTMRKGHKHVPIGELAHLLTVPQ